MEGFKTPLRPKYRVSKPQRIRERTQPWTASRSQRLLRPLLSRIALLKKDNAFSAPLPTQTSSAELLQRKAAPSKRPAEDSHPWLAPRKKLRRTYAQKCATSHPLQVSKTETVKFKPAKDLHRDSCTGEVVAFTPLLRRVRGHHVSSPIQGPDTAHDDGHTQKKCISASNGKFGERLAALRTQVPPARYADCEAIFRNTEAMLIAISNKTSSKTGNKGASSLLAMCLRKVPQYVAGIEAWEVHEAEKHGTRSSNTGSDVAPRIYTELESLGASDAGWVHLRSVVQADGLDALADAVSEGLFPDEFTIILIELCFDYGVSPLGGLCEAFFARKYPEPLSPGSRFSEASILRPMSFLRDISARNDRPSLLLQNLSSLLIQGLLPHTWLGTSEFEDIWALAYRLLAKKQAALDAVDFLATSLVLLCRHQSITSKQKHSGSATELHFACQRTLTEALSILSAMRRLGQDEILAGNSLKLDKVARIGRSLGFIFHACIAEVESWKGKWVQPRDLICLATFLSSTESQGERVNIVVTRAIDSVHGNQNGRTQQSHEVKISLISGIAKICGRGTAQASRYYLMAFCKQLGLLELQPDVLEDINRAGAFTLAQQSNDLRDLLYAEQLVSNPSRAQDGQARASGKQTLFEGYRWDETISEWVTVSPILQKQVPKRRPFLRSSTHNEGGQGRISEQLRNKAALTTRLLDCASLTDQSGKQNLSTCKIFEALDQTSASAGNENFSTSSHPNRDTCSVTDIQARTALLSKRRSWTSAAEFWASGTEFDASHDELSYGKENRGQVRARKRHSDGVREPLATKRRIRFSGGNVHSDDELGL